MAEISAGKLRNLVRLADAAGRFKMMAIDQRGSLRRALGDALGRAPEAVTYEEVARAKDAVTRILAPYASAVLTDPIYGYPAGARDIPRDVGILLAYEKTETEPAGPDGRERRTSLIEGWTAAKAGRAGANAVKLLLYYHPDASAETRRHQESMARRVGEECAARDLPFLLELLAYPLDAESEDTPQYARAKPDLVCRSAAEFSKPEYGVDVLKLEFPADLRYTEEYCRHVFDSRERPPHYTVAEVREFCRRLDEVSTMPWVILSAGVHISEFLVQVELAAEAGASGFLCGRAIWQDAIAHYPDEVAVERFLIDRGAYNFLRANAAAERALPWHAHRRFEGWENLTIEAGGYEWHRRYGDDDAA